MTPTQSPFMASQATAELPKPAHEWHRDCITLTALQLRHALDFAAPDFDTDEDQRDTHVSIGWAPDGATSDDEGNPDPAGYKVWMTDYPEEGSIPLDESLAGCPVKSAERGRAIAAFGASQSTANLLPSINFDFERTESNGLVLVPKAEAVLRVRDAYEAGRASRAGMEPVADRARAIKMAADALNHDYVRAQAPEDHLMYRSAGLLLDMLFAPAAPAEAKDAVRAEPGMVIRKAFNVEPGSREHFWLLMAPYHLHSVTGKDAENLQSFAADVWRAALAAPSTLRQPEAAGEASEDTKRLDIAELVAELDAAWSKVTKISGSALLAGEKHGKHDKTALYSLACEAHISIHYVKEALRDHYDAARASAGEAQS